MIAAVEMALTGAVAARLRNDEAWAETLAAADVDVADWRVLQPQIQGAHLAPYSEVFVSATAAGLDTEPSRRPIAAVHAMSVRADESVGTKIEDAPQSLLVDIVVVSVHDAPKSRPGGDLGAHEAVSTLLAGQRLLLAGWRYGRAAYTLQWQGSRVLAAADGRLEIADEFSQRLWTRRGVIGPGPGSRGSTTDAGVPQRIRR